jgi:hypothetical protein
MNEASFVRGIEYAYIKSAFLYLLFQDPKVVRKYKLQITYIYLDLTFYYCLM